MHRWRGWSPVVSHHSIMSQHVTGVRCVDFCLSLFSLRNRSPLFCFYVVILREETFSNLSYVRGVCRNSTFLLSVSLSVR